VIVSISSALFSATVSHSSVMAGFRVGEASASQDIGIDEDWSTNPFPALESSRYHSQW
jgi:hypothetical protein